MVDILSQEKSLDISNAKQLLQKGKAVVSSVANSEQGQNIANHGKAHHCCCSFFDLIRTADQIKEREATMMWN